jgi:hypothetical protein
MENEFRSHINTIINANRNRLLAIFIGAGISKSSYTPGNKLPDWSELIEKLKYDLSNIKEHDYLKIAQLYFLTFGEHKYYNTVKKYFPDTIEPSIIHELIFDLNPEIIITTNWDTILENAIKKQGYLYDVVCSDIELVKSTLPKKLIKMHGDFNHHNFVFKEDDYINYSENFPLIENYIKGVLSTHTVLFLGYSYNDMDIKHIIKWIQYRSDCRPPMFLIEFSDNLSQKRYLENFGITTLVLDDKSDTLPDFYTDLMHEFLGILNAKDILYDLSTDEDIIQYIYDKIIIFSDLQYILFSQIKSILIYTNVIFRNNVPYLEFLINYHLKDKYKNILNIYRKFIDAIKKMKIDNSFDLIINNDKLKTIFEILNRAGIKGILLNTDKNGSDEFINFDSCFTLEKSDYFKNIIDFNFIEILSDLADPIEEITYHAFLLYQQNQYENIIPFLDRIIAECRNRRRWIKLFIAMLNKNIIIRHLKYYLFMDRYALIKEYDLLEEYKKLPEDIKIAVEPIYDFLQFNDLYRLFFDISKDLTEKEGHNKTIISGGMVLSSDGGKDSQQQINLLHFVIDNKIMIENYTEYRNIHKKILLIKFTEQALGNKIKLDQIELYTAIKYLDIKSLKELFNDCLPDNEKNICKELILNEDDKKWLVDVVFVNISDQYINAKDFSLSIETYLINTLFIISLINFSKTKIDFILERINSIVSHPGNTISVYESIELFLGFQYNLFSSDFDGNLFIKIIESVIRKINKREWSFHERFSLTTEGLSNVFAYAKKKNAVFNNEKYVRQLIFEISDFNEIDKKEIISSILLNIFLIGNAKIKSIIKKYVLNVDNSIDVDDEPLVFSSSRNNITKDFETKLNLNGKIIFELNLDLVGIKKLSNDVNDKIEKYLTKYEAATYFDGYVVSIIRQIINMYENKKADSMQKLYLKAKSISEKKERMTTNMFNIK